MYVPRRADGFSEAVSSPHPQVQQAARFTFAESGTRNNLTSEGIDDTRVDLTQLDESTGRAVPIAQPTALLSPAGVVHETTSSTSISGQAQNEPIPGTSTSGTEASVPEISVTDNTEGE